MSTINLRVLNFINPPSVFRNLSLVEQACVLDIIELLNANGYFPKGTTAERLAYAAANPDSPAIFEDTEMQRIFIYNSTTTEWSPLQ